MRNDNGLAMASGYAKGGVCHTKGLNELACSSKKAFMERGGLPVSKCTCGTQMLLDVLEIQSK